MKKVFDNVKQFCLKNKKIIIPVVIILIILVIALILFSKSNDQKVVTDTKKKHETTANTSAELISEEEFEGLKFSNISLITKDGYSTFTSDVTNTTSVDSTIQDVNIVLKDKNGNVVITLRGNIGEGLKASETRTITASIKDELKSVTSKEIQKFE